ncbi:MAG TPA: glycosyltransferase family 2 protein [Armatimonadetes bacterium]|nr:glycosyltransferase family 2 protein [Armatimonadota bacterium]
MALDLSIIIVSWNTRADLARCLESVRPALAGLAAETVVVDNGSHDGSGRMVRQRFPWVRLIATGANLGFAAGNNVALAQTTGRYRLLLNPDTVVHGDALAQLVAYADHEPRVGLLGPRLLNADGSLQHSCRRFPTLPALLFRNTLLGRLWPNNPYTRDYLMGDWTHDGPRPVDWLSGACLLARSEMLEQLGGLDERYFMYVEDMDWCRRAWAAGWQVTYLPSAVVTHAMGRASDQQPVAMVRAHHVSMVKYVRRHYGPAAAALAAPLIGLRCLLQLSPLGPRR